MIMSSSSTNTSTTLPENQSNMPAENPDSPPKEEERTLTDHLNKKLLESFLVRMEAGTAGVPRPLQRQENEEEDEEEEQDFGD